MKVLVTDGNDKHALAAVRSLGRKGICVHVGATARFALSFLSRYCRCKVVYPDPVTREKEFVQFLTRYVELEKIDVLLPIGYDANIVVSKYKESISQYVHVAISDYDQMVTAADKGKDRCFCAISWN